MRFFELQDSARAQSVRLVALFALAVAATVLGVHAALALAWWSLDALLPFELPFPALFFSVNVGVTLLLILGGWWIEVSNFAQAGGAEKLARLLGAREARRSDEAEQRLCNIVDEVCIAARMPHPLVMVLPRKQAINAMAAGGDEADSVVAVSQGALDWLTREELQGMVAHECSHIQEGDTRLNMELAGMVSGLELVWRFGDEVRDRGGPAWVIGSIVMMMGSFGWYAGRWLQAAVSRQREFLADARAVQWTRSRDGLGGVLRKAMTQQETLDTAGEPQWQTAMQHLLLVPEMAQRGRWFDAHPPLQERIRRIYGRMMPALPLVRAAS
jgi:Zn-dependent protease with chaperone function